MSETEAKVGLNDKTRWGLTLALGVMVLFWRILIPTNVEITAGIVILVTGLDLVLTVAVIFLNKKELKEVFAKKFTLMDALKTLLLFVISLVAISIFSIVLLITTIEGLTFEAMMTATDPAWLEGMIANASSPTPADWVAERFMAIFPLGAFISMVICAPIWEEIVFRMSGKNLLKNPVLFVVVTSCLFAFIHTVNFSIVDNASYLFFGVIYSVAYLVLKDVRILMIAHFVNNLISVSGGLLS